MIQSENTHRQPHLSENSYSPPASWSRGEVHYASSGMEDSDDQEAFFSPEIFAFLNWKFRRRNSKWLNSRKTEVITSPASSLRCEEWHPWVIPSQTPPLERKKREVDTPSPSLPHSICLASVGSLWRGLQDLRHFTDGDSKVQSSQVISLRSFS